VEHEVAVPSVHFPQALLQDWHCPLEANEPSGHVDTQTLLLSRDPVEQVVQVLASVH
jgi:hypothetical protein